MANVNEGHRQRLRERMLKEGLGGFQDHEVLELLLFQYLPRQDTNKIAHELLNKFGTIANVLNASPKQLMSVKGISQTTACNLAMLKEVWYRYRRSSVEGMSMSTIADILRFGQNLMADAYEEKFVAAYLDDNTNYLTSDEYTSGNDTEVKASIKKIVTGAVSANASGVMIFHCHTFGLAQPSKADMAFTEKLFVTLANINIVLLEHLIINNEGQYYSFVKNGDMAVMAEKYKNKK